MPQISVIVPVYKVEPYLPHCIDSILAQTFTDFELILVDDGSPDNSGAICDEYAAKDKRVRVIHQENKGQAAARNAAIRQAKGKYYCFIDSDDFVHPSMLSILIEAIQDNDKCIVCCSYTEGTECPQDFFAEKDYISTSYPVDENSITALYKVPGICWIACGKLIPAQIVNSHLFSEGRVYEDNAVVPSWLLEADQIIRIDQALYYYRFNPKGTTKSTFTIKKRIDNVWAYSEQLYTLENAGMIKLCLQRIPGLLHLCAVAYDNNITNNPVYAQEIISIASPWWKVYKRNRPLASMKDKQAIGLFHPCLKKVWHLIKRSCKHDP